MAGRETLGATEDRSACDKSNADARLLCIFQPMVKNV